MQTHDRQAMALRRSGRTLPVVRSGNSSGTRPLTPGVPGAGRPPLTWCREPSVTIPPQRYHMRGLGIPGSCMWRHGWTEGLGRSEEG